MALYAVEYTYNADKAAVRDELRPAHRDWLKSLYEAGVARLVGPYTDQSGALIVIESSDGSALHTLLAEDPFATADAIEAVRVREWHQVYGPL